MIRMMHRFLLHNDDIRDAGEKNLSPGQVGAMAGWGVFSTIRVADGVLFAFERHWERMRRDAALLRVPFPAHAEWMLERLQRLIDANGARDASLRAYVLRNKGGIWEGPGIDREFDVIGFTTDLNDWGASVRLGWKTDARHSKCEFSGTKMLSWSFNLAWYEEAHTRGFDEVVLLNERGEVSECTSANIFAVYGNQVWTPPLGSGCLPGVTRGLLLEEVRAAGITVAEKTLLPEDLEAAEGVFISSTTRDILPVAFIEGLRVRQEARVHPALLSAFVDHRRQYVAAARSAAVVR